MVEDKVIPFLSFKTILAEQLCPNNSLQKTKVGRPKSSTLEQPFRRRCIDSRPNKYIQTDQCSYWPIGTTNRYDGKENQTCCMKIVK